MGGNYGAAYVFYGPVTGVLSVDNADATLQGYELSFAGTSVDVGGDVNGDGYDDILVGGYLANQGAGAAYVVHGPVNGTIDLSAADARFVGVDDEYIGLDVSWAGDVNSDGYDDFLVGAPISWVNGDARGAAYLVLGPVKGGQPIAAAAATKFLGANTGDLGVAVTGGGDLNGDGIDDVVIGDFADDAGGSRAGAAYVFYGPVAAGNVDVATADAKLVGVGDDDFAGYSLARVGDLNQDGVDDLVVGAAGGTGKAYVLYGPISGVKSLEFADLTLEGVQADEEAGTSVALAGDVNNDGVLDLMVGAPQRNLITDREGVAYLVYGTLPKP